MRFIALPLLLPALLLVGGERYWEKFPCVEEPMCIGLDERGGMWMMAGRGCYYWDSGVRAWSDPVLHSGVRLEELHGTPDTGLYVTQLGDEEHVGAVYRLCQGRTERVTTFDYEDSGVPPPFFVARDGRLLNWGRGRLRVFSGEKWVEYPAALPHKGTLIFDRGETISLYAEGHLYVVDDQNKMVHIESDNRVARRPAAGALWGTDKAVLMELRPRSALCVFDVLSGAPVAEPRIDPRLLPYETGDMCHSPDGAVWLLACAYHQARQPHFWCRLAPDGEVRMFPTAALPRTIEGSGSASARRALVAADGSFWFASGDVGVIQPGDSRMRRFRSGEDGAPRAANSLLSDRDGVVYVAASDRVYAYNVGVPLTHHPNPLHTPLGTLRDPAWTHRLEKEESMVNVWYAQDLLLYTIRGSESVQAIDAQSGEKRFTIASGSTEEDYVWDIRKGTVGERLVVRVGTRILTVDAADGTVKNSITRKREPFGALSVVPIEDGFLITRSQGLTRPRPVRSLCRLDADGNALWTTRLPGYGAGRPFTHGSLTIIQGTKAVFGKQVVCGVDNETGRLLWDNVIESANGFGVAFASDGHLSVEGYAWHGRDGSNGRLICRRPGTGEVVWEHDREGAALCQPPTVDPATGRVYALFRTGDIACLNGGTGDTVWATELPDVLPETPYPVYVERNGCLTMCPGFLAVTDTFRITNILDTANGALLERIDLVDPGGQANRGPWTDGIAGAPWIIGGRLVVPFRTGIRAYNMDFGNRYPKPSPAIEWAESPATRVESENAVFGIRLAGGGGRPLIVRCRLDDEAWHEATTSLPRERLIIPRPPNGTHVLRIQAYDSCGRGSQPRTHRFEMAWDREAAVANLVTRLGAENYSDREEAERVLIDWGQGIMPGLLAHQNHDDPEVRVRICRILRVLRGQPRRQ